MTEHFIDNNGVRIHAVEFNSRSIGTPIIMVPGMINSAEEVAASIGSFITRRTIILSIRGRGKSGSPAQGWRLEDQASDVATVINHFGFPKIVSFGHSTGGSIAARALPMLSAEVSAFIIGDFAPIYPPYSEGWRKRVQELPEFSISDIALAGIVREAKQTDVSEYLNGIRNNLHAITGDPDTSLLKAGEIERLKQMFPKITIEHLNGCGHEFLSDDPARSVAVIEKIAASTDQVGSPEHQSRKSASSA